MSDYKNQRQINIHEICKYRKSMKALGMTVNSTPTALRLIHVKDKMEDYNKETLHWLQTIRLRESVYSKPFDIPDNIIEHKDELVGMLASMDQDMIMESEDSQASYITEQPHLQVAPRVPSVFNRLHSLRLKRRMLRYPMNRHF